MRPAANVTGKWEGTGLNVVLGLALAALLLVARHGALAQDGWIDPWIYTGLALDFPGLTERFGTTYYSLRVVHILPAAFFQSVLGLEAGYVAWRLILVATLFVCLAHIARGFVGAVLARVLATTFVVHPWLFRSLSWDYCDGTGLVLLAILLVWLDRMGGSDRAIWAMLAGATVAFAGNSNLFLIPVGGVLWLWPLPAIVRRTSWKGVPKVAALGLAGFVAGYLLLVLARFAAAPREGLVFDVLGIAMGSKMAAGGGEVWHEDVLRLIAAEGRWELLAPALVLGILAIAMLAARETALQNARVVGAAFALAGTVAGFCVADFGLKVGVISLPFYFVYLAPAVFLGACAALSSSPAATREESRLGVVLAVVVVLAGAMFATSFSDAALASPMVAVAACVLVAGCLAWGCVGGTSAPVLVAVAGVASSIPFYAGHWFYRPLDREAAAREWSLYRIGAALFERVGVHPRDKFEVGFWYSNRWESRPSALDGLNSLWLWSRTRIQEPGTTSAPGMPTLSTDEEARARKFRNLLLLSWNRHDVAEGVATIESRIGIESREEFELSDGTLDLYAEMVRIPDQKALRKRQRQEERRRERDESQSGVSVEAR